jgi:putative ATPase
MSLKELIFWEKYRPQSLKQMILLPRIANLVDSEVDTNYIFYGSSGLGKTTLARILAKEQNSLILKGKLGIDILTEKIEKHFTALNFDAKDKQKLIVIDEFDNASSALQEALKGFMEEYPFARFLFTTNYLDKIEDKLRSRFVCVPFDPIDSNEREFLFNKQVNYLRAISKKEEFALYTEVEPFKKMVMKSYPDLRSAVNLLQVVIKTGDISIINAEYGSTKDELYNFIMDGNVNPLSNYDYVMNNFFLTFDDAFKYLSRPFFEYMKEFHIQIIIDKGALILKKQKEYNETLNITTDPLIHLINFIIDLKTIIIQ